MSQWFLVAVLIVLAALATLLMKRDRAGAGPVYSYRKKVLFSPAETTFARALREAIGGDYRMLAKVRVADLMTPATGLNRSDWQRAFNRISAKHVDFVLCSDNLDVIAAIELDDRSHNSAKARARDALVNDAFHSAGVPLLRFKVRSEYQPAAIRAEIGTIVHTAPHD